LSPPLPSVATALDSRCQVCNTLGAENSHAAVAAAGPGGRIEMNKKARCAGIMTVGDLSMLSHLPIKRPVRLALQPGYPQATTGGGRLQRQHRRLYVTCRQARPYVSSPPADDSFAPSPHGNTAASGLRVRRAG
jgi:hypothetical protein